MRVESGAGGLERTCGVVADAMFCLGGTCLRAMFVDGAGAGGGTFVGIARERVGVGACFNTFSRAHGGGACESAVISFWKNGTRGVAVAVGAFFRVFSRCFSAEKRSRSVVRPRPAVLRWRAPHPGRALRRPRSARRLPLWLDAKDDEGRSVLDYCMKYNKNPDVAKMLRARAIRRGAAQPWGRCWCCAPRLEAGVRAGKCAASAPAAPLVVGGSAALCEMAAAFRGVQWLWSNGRSASQ